jgi:hypothetical protein
MHCDDRSLLVRYFMVGRFARGRVDSICAEISDKFLEK